MKKSDLLILYITAIIAVTLFLIMSFVSIFITDNNLYIFLFVVSLITDVAICVALYLLVRKPKKK